MLYKSKSVSKLVYKDSTMRTDIASTSIAKTKGKIIALSEQSIAKKK